MTKHRVFIYGSCVSRDTFEHFDPDQFELVQYVARQSALSAYTRPVTLVEPPAFDSPFQQRMVAGDYASSLQVLIPQHAAQTDLMLIDLTDERLGAYILPDGSVITRSMEFINSGAEHELPSGSQHLPFGSDQHFQYWSQGIAAVGELIRQHMPHAAVVLLNIPWAERSESGGQTPDSFGVRASDANPVFEAYAQVAASSLGAEIITLAPGEVTSSPDHPWGEAPFHYASSAYRRIVKMITGSHGREAWQPSASAGNSASTPQTGKDPSSDSNARRTAPGTAGETGPNLFITGAHHSGTNWLAHELDRHPEVQVAKSPGNGYFDSANRLKSNTEESAYFAAFDPGYRWRADHTPSYFWHSSGSTFGPKRVHAAQQINKSTSRDSTFLVVLREPVERAMAAYWHHFSMGRFDLPRGIFQLPKQLGVVDQGFYKRHLDRWQKEIGSGRLRIVIYDDIVADPTGTLKSILNTLELDTPHDDWLESIKTPASKSKPWLKPFQRRTSVTEQELAALFELYRRDVAAVEKAIGRELSQWRKRAAIIRRILDDPGQI